MNFVSEVEGLREGNTLYHVNNGFYFRASDSSGRCVYMKCRVNTCPGRATMPLNPRDRVVEMFATTSGHNHPPDEEFIDVLTLRRSILRRCQDEVTDFRRIFDEECARVPLEVSTRLSYESLRMTMYRTRRSDLNVVPQSLSSLGELLGHPQYVNLTRTISGNQFYLGTLEDNVHGTSVVFGSTHFMELLPNVTEIHVDGTFKVRPNVPPSRQLLTIMAMHFNRAFPVFFVLMETKTKEAYELVLDFVQHLAPLLQPTVIITDFERSLQQALRSKFPNSHILGCFFHSSQAMWRKAKRLGLTRQINENEFVKRAVRMCLCLALLPADKIQEGYDSVERFTLDNGVNEIVAEFLQYIRNTWITGVGREHLSVFGQARRTNNDQESYHNQLRRQMRHAHPNLWVFIDGLKKTEHAYVHRHMTYVNGVARNVARQAVYVAHDQRLATATSLLVSGRYSVLEFLLRALHVTSSFHHVPSEDEEDYVGPPPPVENDVGPLPADVPPPIRVRRVLRGLGGRGRRHGNRGRVHPPNANDANMDVPQRGRVRRGGRRGRPQGQGLRANQPIANQAPLIADANGAGVPVEQPQAIVEPPVRQPGTCVACIENRATHVVIPCGHLCLCAECHEQLQRHNAEDRCPYCRDPATSIFRVFAM